MRLVAAASTLSHISESGGSVYVWPRSVRCCGGRMHSLEASLQAPERVFEVIYEEAGVVLHATPGLARAEEIELRVSRRGHLQAFWNGQAWIG